jgi:thioredoxin-like negative regulator of GroEL
MIRIVLVLCILFSVALPSWAQAPSLMQKGLADLGAGRYAAARMAFEDAVKKDPANMQARYCLAVCYHHLGRFSEAAQDYGYVAKSATDPALQRRAKKGLDGCAGLTQTSTAVMPQSTSFKMDMGSEPAADAAPIGLANSPMQRAAALTGEPMPEATPPQQQMLSLGTPSIIYFYTAWCGHCKIFAPWFENASSKYAGRISFQKFDAEAPENKDIREQYKGQINGYPTVIYQDGSGKIVDVHHGRPHDEAGFEKDIEKFLASKS